MTEFRKLDGSEVVKKVIKKKTKLLKYIDCEDLHLAVPCVVIDRYDHCELIRRLGEKGIVRCYDKGDNPLLGLCYIAEIGDEFDAT